MRIFYLFSPLFFGGITLQVEQLKKIIEAPVTEFYFEAGKEPIEGELNSKTKEFFKEFMDKCMAFSGVKK